MLELRRDLDKLARITKSHHMLPYACRVKRLIWRGTSAMRAWRLAGLALFSLILAGCSIFGSPGSGKIIEHTVKRGDTVFEIAQRYGSSVEAISKLNKIDDPRTLKVGVVLRVPTGKSAGGTARRGGLQQARKTKAEGNSLRSVKLSDATRYLGQLAWPIEGGGGQLRSLFGTRWGDFHEGLDISAQRGTPIRAAHDGEVVYSDDDLSSYGNMIVIRTENLMTIYGHNDENLVKVGDKVKKGQQIAILGMTGRATGPHVHFETRIKDADGDNVAVDPLVFFQKGK
jgi:murein DD-endopeptidase MepM/ murein hydrolase activator NlpD